MICLSSGMLGNVLRNALASVRANVILTVKTINTFNDKKNQTVYALKPLNCKIYIFL